jgi:hypothetical protein
VAQFALFVAWLGGMVQLVSIPVAIMYVAELRKHGAYTRVAARDCANLLAARRLPRRAAVYGRTVAGPDGQLVAPASGRRCVWYETVVTEVVADSTGAVLARHTAGAPMGLADRTGPVGVDPALVVRELVEPTDRRPAVVRETVDDEVDWSRVAKLAPHRERADPGSYRLTERVVDAGRWVYVLGRPVRRDGRIVLRRRWLGVSGVSGRSGKAIRAGAASELTGYRSMLGLTLVAGPVIAGIGLGLWYLVR